MIFVCLGTKRFPFNRLLKQIDLLIEQKEIKSEVFAQIGSSTYKPKHYDFSEFLSSEEYIEKVEQSNIVITHGGTGAIIKALKAGKQIVAVPRLEKFGEHSDDHQLQIVEFFTEQGYIRRVDDIRDLNSVLKELVKNPITLKFKSRGVIVQIIDNFIKAQTN